MQQTSTREPSIIARLYALICPTGARWRPAWPACCSRSRPSCTRRWSGSGWSICGLAQQDWVYIGWQLALLVLVFGVGQLFSAVRGVLLERAGQRLTLDLRLRLYRKLQSQSAAYFSQRRTGDLLARLTADVETVQNVLVQGTDLVANGSTYVRTKHAHTANLPVRTLRRSGSASRRAWVRLGDGVLDLAALAAEGTLDEDPRLFAQPSLNAFMAAGPATWARVRAALTALARGVDAEPGVSRSSAPSCCCPSRSRTTWTSSAPSPRPAGRGDPAARQRRSAAAQLAPPARRLPRACGHGRRRRHAVRRPRGQRRGPVRRTARPSASTSSSSSATSSVRRARTASRSRSATRSTTSSGRCSSTTGAPATCRPGRPSRWARSWPSRSRRRSRRG